MAVLNFVYFILFYLVYRDPSADRRLTPLNAVYPEWRRAREAPPHERRAMLVTS